MQDCVQKCKERRGQMQSTKEFWSRKQFTDSSSMEQWLLARKRIGKRKVRSAFPVYKHLFHASRFFRSRDEVRLQLRDRVLRGRQQPCVPPARRDRRRRRRRRRPPPPRALPLQRQRVPDHRLRIHRRRGAGAGSADADADSTDTDAGASAAQERRGGKEDLLLKERCTLW